MNKETTRQQNVQSNNNDSDNEVRNLLSLSKPNLNLNKNPRSPIASNCIDSQNETQALSMLKKSKFFKLKFEITEVLGIFELQFL